MARLVTANFETNSLTKEGFTDNNGFSVQTSTIRNGQYAAQTTSPPSSANAFYGTLPFQSSATTAHIYICSYVYFATLPTAENTFYAITHSNTGAVQAPDAWITVDNLGALRLYDTTSVIGSASSALSINTWYRIELEYDSTVASPNRVVRARIDGTEFAGSAARSSLPNVQSLNVGINLKQETQTTGQFYFDDIAMNDASGTTNNSYPGETPIISGAIYGNHYRYGIVGNGMGRSESWT